MADETKKYDGLKEIYASEILAKIEKGDPIVFDHVKIIGAIDFGKNHQNNPIACPSEIYITNSIIDHFAFSSLVLEEKVVFRGSSFVNMFGVYRTQFNKKIDFSNCRFKSEVCFDDCQFLNETKFDKCLFAGNTSFTGCQFGYVKITMCRFQAELNFTIPGARTQLEEPTHQIFSIYPDRTDPENKELLSLLGPSYPSSRITCFNGIADFEGCYFGKDVIFQRCKFEKSTSFIGSKFIGFADFMKVQFDSNANFWKSQFLGDVSFKNAVFAEPYGQEQACRAARQALERLGDRERAGYYFYREMDGKRKQKKWYIRYPEFIFIQLVFGYGVHPLRLWAFWFGFVFLFAVIYWLGHGIDVAASQLNGNATLIDYIWFSIATAVTPGYAGYKPTNEFKLVAGFEAIFGTFMWAAFIATFARKYMR